MQSIICIRQIMDRHFLCVCFLAVNCSLVHCLPRDYFPSDENLVKDLTENEDITTNLIKETDFFSETCTWDTENLTLPSEVWLTSKNKTEPTNVSLNGTDQGLYNPGLFEGDIILTPTLLERNAITDERMLWPHGALVYTIDDSVGCPDSWQCALLMNAMEQYHQTSCVRFKEWSGEPHRVHIFLNEESGSCWSRVGRTGDEVQLLSLGRNCWYRGIVLHELLHAVGFWHEMNRPDRDSFVSVFWDNIQTGFTSAFYRQDNYEVDTLGERFDYRSVMMYDEYAFSKDGVSETLRATEPGVVIGPIWKKTELSNSDIRRLHTLYSCQGSSALSGFPYNMQCDFNSHSCGFKNGGAAQWSWRRLSDSDGFLSTSWEAAGSNVTLLQSSTLHATHNVEMGCARFWYFLQGDGEDSYLRLMHAYLRTAAEVNFNPETSYELWSSDQISGSWIHIQIPLYVNRPFKLLFVSSFDAVSTHGTIAIDDIELFYTSCEGQPESSRRSARRSPLDGPSFLGSTLNKTTFT